MKKTLSWMLVAAFATVGLAACDKKPGGPSDGAVPTPSTTSPAPAPSPTPAPSPSATPSPDTSASSPAGAASS